MCLATSERPSLTGGGTRFSRCSLCCLKFSGYYSEQLITVDYIPRWNCRYNSMVFLLHIAFMVLIGPSAATNSENRNGDSLMYLVVYTALRTEKDFVPTDLFSYIVYALLVGLANTGRLLGLLSVLSFGGCFSEGTYDYALPYYNGVSFGKVARWALAFFGQVHVLDSTLTDPALKGFIAGSRDDTYGYAVPYYNGARFDKVAPGP